MKRFIDSVTFPALWLTGFGGGGFCWWLSDQGNPAWVGVMIASGIAHLAGMLWFWARLSMQEGA